MKAQFLGTGTSQGVPIIACSCAVCRSKDTRDQRLRSSLLMQWDDKNIVIDTGPDFREQMLRCGISRLDAVLYTHEHRDHTSGFDDIRAFNYIMQQPIDMYCTERVEKAIRYEFHYAFEENRYPGVPEANLHRIHELPFELFGERIIPIPVMHHKLPVIGFRFRDFAYITDANYISESSIALLHGCKTIVLNALRHEKHISHFTLQEAIEMAQRIGAQHTYLTHISHQLGLHETTELSLPQGIYLAYDGLTIDIV